MQYDIALQIETPYLYCPHCARYAVVRPQCIHPKRCMTLRLMGHIARVMQETSARLLSGILHLSQSSILRADKDIHTLIDEARPICLDGRRALIIESSPSATCAGAVFYKKNKAIAHAHIKRVKAIHAVKNTHLQTLRAIRSSALSGRINSMVCITNTGTICSQSLNSYAGCKLQNRGRCHRQFFKLTRMMKFISMRGSNSRKSRLYRIETHESPARNFGNHLWVNSIEIVNIF